MFRNIFPREKYISRIRPFFDSDIIKIITGIRRCGKSCIMKAIINELYANGVDESRVIYIPLDRRGFKYIGTAEQLEEKIESFITDDGFYYLFIDEVQNVQGFESVVQAYAEEGYSVFLTGSNSYLLSDDISTKLTGRYLNFETYTLDFNEYIQMKVFFKLNVNDNLSEEFKEFILNGGFPKSLEFPDVDSRQVYTRGIISEIFDKDIRKRKRISNVAVFERVQSFILNNYSKTFSFTNLTGCLRKEGFVFKDSTVRGYIEDIKKAKIIYECNRFDLKSKRSIRREQKYYLADLSIYFSTNIDNNLSFGPSLENIVYLYLVSNGYQVSVGRIGNLECDFIVTERA